MKHLLILLSILLLSSPLFGHPTGEHTLYLWETSSGKVWKGIGDKELQVYYEGELKNGEPNGLGVIINTNKGKYVGEWKDGKKHGQGTFTYGKGKWEGEKYEGEFKDGYRHGQGTYTWSDGDKYEGEFEDDKPNGQGTYTWSDGDKYVGEFEDGIKHGQGISTALDGQRWNTLYEGEWEKGKFHGQGKLVVTKIDDDGTLLGRWNLGKWKGLTIIGEFRNGNFWDTKSYNDKGEQQTFSVVQGKWYGE